MIDHRYFPHIIDLILSYVSLQHANICRAVCAAWREHFDIGQVRHVTIVFRPVTDEIAIITRNSFNDRYRTLCPSEPPAFWTSMSEAERARWEALLAGVEVVDIECIGAPLLETHKRAFDGQPAETTVSSASVQNEPAAIAYNEPDSAVTALETVLGWVAHAPVVRWRGEREQGLTIQDAFKFNPRLRMLQPQERVYFCHVGCRIFPEFEQSSKEGFSPIIAHIDFEDDFHEEWLSDSDEDLYPDPNPERPNWLYRIPMIIGVLKVDSPPPALDEGRPHLTYIFDGADLDLAYGRRTSLLDHFYCACYSLASWRIWVVGLELFLDRDDPSPGVTWNALIAEVQAMWQRKVIIHRSAGLPHVRFLTHAEYRAAVNDPYLHRLRTVR